MSILEHHFPPLIAEKYGVNAAIFLRDIYHWCETNRNNEENYHDGRWWTYQTIGGLCKRHTYWTKNQVEHIIRSCKEKGALLSGHFGENQFNRTCWYALTDEAMALFDGPAPISEKPEMDAPKIAESISEKSEIDSQEIPESNRKNQKCYKDKNNKTKDKNPIAPCANDPEWTMFYRFWAVYPRKKNKDGAMRAWRKLNPDLKLCRAMWEALKKDKQSEQWQKSGGEFIPYPSSWLNARRWEDEHEDPSIRRPDPPDKPLRGVGVRYS